MTGKNDPHRLTGIQTKMTEDGQVLGLSFERADGTRAEITVAFNDMPDLILALESQARQLLERLNQSLGPGDRRMFHPPKARSVTKLQGAVARGNVPILTLELDGQLVMDFALGTSDLPALIEWLEGVHKLSQTEPPKLS